MGKPLITVGITTYNHEKYIAEAIQSILDQTLQDFEIVIVNDGSTDKTEDVIKGFTDPRIKYFYQENMGPSVCANTVIKKSSGKYFAWLSGDDVCCIDRLEKQLNRYKKGKTRLLFANCSFIDDDSNAIDNREFYEDNLSEIIQRNKDEVLNHFFYKGNYLNAITCFTERLIFEELGFYDIRLLQTQDYDMWVKALIKGFDVEIMSDKIIKYRIRNDNQNLDSPRRDAILRKCFEFKKIYNNYLTISDKKRFLSVFPETLMVAPNFIIDDIPYVILKLAQSSDNPVLKEFAINNFYESLNEKYYIYLKKKFNFRMQDLFSLTGTESAEVVLITRKRIWKILEATENYLRKIIPQRILRMNILKRIWYS